MGLGELGRSTTLQKVNNLPFIVQLACGSNHALALDKDGALWVTGCNLSGQQGRNSNNKVFTRLDISDTDSKFMRIFAGFNQNFALDNTRKLWAWGNNSHGQLGIKDALEQPSQVVLPHELEIEELHFGLEFTVILCKKGQLYTCGNNEFGQLGRENKKTSTFQKVPTIPIIRSVDTGWHHTIALDYSGHVWGFGCNAIKQLALPFNPNGIFSPTRMTCSAQYVLTIACGPYISYLQTSDAFYKYGMSKIKGNDFPGMNVVLKLHSDSKNENLKLKKVSQFSDTFFYFNNNDNDLIKEDFKNDENVGLRSY